MGTENTINKLLTWFRNLRTVHHRWMMSYLRRRGWIVFYLEKEYRECNDLCWLKLYKELEGEEKV